MTAEKNSIVENITEAPLVDPAKRELVPRLKEILTEWYDMYKNQESGLMDDRAIAKFIHGATKSPCQKDDNNVKSILA